MAERRVDRSHALPAGVAMTEQPSALDRLDPSGRNAWGFSRAAGPTATDDATRIAELERENQRLRRLAADLDARCTELTRAAEARDRGRIRTDP